VAPSRPERYTSGARFPLPSARPSPVGSAIAVGTALYARSSAMKQTIYQVDAFTDEPFHGNPAGVCLLERSVNERFMQQVAAEMNLSETAFLLERSDGYGLRWFTPTVEVDLCGHATLASAHILWEVGAESPEETLRFHTRSGVLQAKRRAE